MSVTRLESLLFVVCGIGTQVSRYVRTVPTAFGSTNIVHFVFCFGFSRLCCLTSVDRCHCEMASAPLRTLHGFSSSSESGLSELDMPALRAWRSPRALAHGANTSVEQKSKPVAEPHCLLVGRGVGWRLKSAPAALALQLALLPTTLLHVRS